MRIFDQAREKFNAFMQSRKEQAQADKAQRIHVADQLHGHSRFWLLNVPATATILAAFVEVYWAILFCIEATGRVDANLSLANGSSDPFSLVWNFAFSGHLFVLLGLVAATAPIVMISMVWLPVQFAMRGAGRWRRGSIIAVGLLANLLVIVSGTVVMNANRQSQVRDALVVEQTADAQRAMLVANVDGLQHELDTLMNHRSTYVATASSVGAVAYERDYVAQARATNDPRLPLIERALGSARRADELRAQITEARRSVAAAQPAAASAANVQDTVGAELNTFSQYVEVWRPPFIALICTLIGIFGTWWVIAMLERMNPKDVLRSGWAPEELRIEDKRDEPAGEVQPMTPPRKRRKVYNPETGREEVFVQPKGHWRPVGKKVRNADGTVGELMEVTPEAQPDETGVEYDGGGRVGLAAADPDAGVETEHASKPEDGNANEQVVAGDAQTDIHPEPSYEPQETLSDEEAVALAEEYALAAAEKVDANGDASEQPAQPEGEVADDDADPVQDISPTDRQPETREDRLLPAVAAE